MFSAKNNSICENWSVDINCMTVFAVNVTSKEAKNFHWILCFEHSERKDSHYGKYHR
jgi:hypothetical protein